MVGYGRGWIACWWTQRLGMKAMHVSSQCFNCWVSLPWLLPRVRVGSYGVLHVPSIDFILWVNCWTRSKIAWKQMTIPGQEYNCGISLGLVEAINEGGFIGLRWWGWMPDKLQNVLQWVYLCTWEIQKELPLIWEVLHCGQYILEIIRGILLSDVEWMSLWFTTESFLLSTHKSILMQRDSTSCLLAQGNSKN